MPPGLHFVATPIGNARDITLRALDVLGAADVIAAEDTRTARRLMDIHGIPVGGRPLVAYHEHNGPRVRPRLLRDLSEGKSVAYVSEAGTPLVADPGFVLGREAIAAGHDVFAVPGASAVLSALTVSGLATDRFLFAGFPPPKEGARRSYLAELADIPATLVFFLPPRHLDRVLGDFADVFGNRPAALCREMTKRFEEVRRGTLSDLAIRAADGVKGEVVLVVDRPGVERGGADIEAELADALRSMTVRDAAQHVASLTGAPKREVYELALRLKADNDGTG